LAVFSPVVALITGGVVLRACPLRSLRERLGVLLLLAYLTVALHAVGQTDIIGDDEAREVGIVRSIVGGEWLWPRFNEDTLPDKPILFHWLAALPCLIAGFSATAVRLPAALAAAALVGWTASFGARLLGSSGRMVAAVLLATMPALFEHACVARPDTLLVLLLTGTLGLAFRWWRDEQRGDATATLTLLGAATFAKGPVAPVLFALTLGGFLCWQRELDRVRTLFTWPGVTAFLCLGFGWYVVALAGWGELFVQEHVVGRYVGNVVCTVITNEGCASRSLGYHLFFYPLHLLILALPWAPFFVYALWEQWRTGRFCDPRQRFLLCWALVPVVVFTLAAYKLRYYMLPSLPAVAFLTAPTIQAFLKQPLRRPTWVRSLTAGAIGLLLFVMVWIVLQNPALLYLSDRRNLALILTFIPGGAHSILALCGVGIGLIVGGVVLHAWAVLIGGLALANIVWLTLGAPAFVAAQSSRDSLRPFAAAVEVRCPAPAPLVFYKMQSRPVIVYLGRRIPTLWQAEALTPGMVVIAREQDYQELAAAKILAGPLLTAEGRIGNLGHSRVLLAETRDMQSCGDH
jgi:4-amino-4-deoxy-L-arabinose transferase-like glycosyltransferase